MFGSAWQMLGSAWQMFGRCQKHNIILHKLINQTITSVSLFCFLFCLCFTFLLFHHTTATLDLPCQIFGSAMANPWFVMANPWFCHGKTKVLPLILTSPKDYFNLKSISISTYAGTVLFSAFLDQRPG